MLHSLVLNHPFVDGNKRTAVVATLVFLDLNGGIVQWDKGEALAFVLDIAVHRVDLAGATAFLRQRMVSK